MHDDGRDLEHFGHLMRALCELYDKPFSLEKVEIYYNALTRYPLEDVQRAFNAHAADPERGMFMPKPADVVRHLEGTGTARAQAAWTRVYDALRHVGPWQSVVFDDPRIHAVLSDMGGWIALGQLQEKEAPFRAREFETRYRAYLERPPREYPRQLLGHTAHAALMAGHPAPAPVLVGDPDAARQVYLAGGDTARPGLTRLDAAALLPGATG